MFGRKTRVLSNTPTPKPFGKNDHNLDFPLVSGVSPTVTVETSFYSPTVNERFPHLDRVLF